METKIARGISWLFHPLLIPVYTLLMLLNLDIFTSHQVPVLYKKILVGIVLLTTFVLPLSATWFMARFKLVSSFFLRTKEERIYPLLVVSVFYYVTYFLMRSTHITSIFSYYMLGATLLSIMSLVVNFYRKISLHMIGIGGFTGLFLGLALNFGINLTIEVTAAIMLAGVIGFARLKSDSHDPAEIYSGFIMGALTMTLLMMLL